MPCVYIHANLGVHTYISILTVNPKKLFENLQLLFLIQCDYNNDYNDSPVMAQIPLELPNFKPNTGQIQSIFSILAC